MKIELQANGLDHVLKRINSELVNALDAKHKKDKDRCISRAIGLVQAACHLTIVRDEEPESDEPQFHGNYDEDG